MTTRYTDFDQDAQQHRSLKSIIWPVACIIALALGFFIGGRTSTNAACLEALKNADTVNAGVMMYLQNQGSGAESVWLNGAKVSMDEYQSNAAKCRGE